MEIAEVIREIENRKRKGELKKRRVTCIHCGKTWIEIVGVVVAQKEGYEDLYLRIGTESENCFACRWRPVQCENCNAHDVYEITFTKNFPEETILSFKNIRKVANNRAHTAPV